MRIALLFLAWLLTAGCSGGDGSESPDAAIPGDSSTSVKPLSAQELQTACIRITACGIRQYPSLGVCINTYQNIYVRQEQKKIWDSIYGCVNAAGADCNTMSACYRRGGPCNNTFKASCDGTKATSCDLIDKRTFTLDCGLAGLKCVVRTDKSFTATCTRAACTPGYQEKCSGRDTLLSCAAGVVEVQSCADKGLICRTGKDGTGCSGNQTITCKTGDVSPLCEGDEAVSCVFNRVHRVDCKKSGNTCKAGTCQAPQANCDAQASSKCNGDKLSACVGDKWTDFDCKALGLGPCKTVGTWARCSTAGGK